MKRTIGEKLFPSAILTAVLLTSLSACGGTPAGAPSSETSQTVSAQSTESTATETTVPPISPALPDKELNGREFNILINGDRNEVWIVKDVWVERENGDPINDAVFERNRRVEDKFNVKLKQTPGTKASGLLKSAILAGDGVYDTAQMTINDGLSLATAKLLTPLSEVKHIDPDAAWWDTESMNSIELAGKGFICIGDISIADNDSTWCILFAKDVAEQVKAGDMYKTVRDGAWTLDKMQTIGRSAYRDLDGNSVAD